MPTVQQMIEWVRTGQGRLVAAALVFGLIWALKSIPWVKASVLTTPRRKQAAAVLIAMAPACTMLADPSLPLWDVLASAITIALGAMGVNALRPAKSEPTVE